MWRIGGLIGTRRQTACDVLIVGAGLTGMTAAIFLDQRGARVRVIDQLPRTPERPGSVVLGRADLAAFDQVGLMADLLCRSNPYARAVIDLGESAGDGQVLGYRPREAPIIARSALVDLLETDVFARRIPVLHGERVEDAMQIPSAVHADLSGGARCSAGLLIGADGAASRIREEVDATARLGIGGAWRISGRALRDRIPSDLDELLTHDTAVIAGQGPLRFIAHADDPTGDDCIGWTIRLDTPALVSSDWQGIASDEAVLSRAEGLLVRDAPATRGILAATRGLSVRPLIEVLPPLTTRLGRMVTVGAAAHGDAEEAVIETGWAVRAAMQVADTWRGPGASRRIA